MGKDYKITTTDVLDKENISLQAPHSLCLKLRLDIITGIQVGINAKEVWIAFADGRFSY